MSKLKELRIAVPLTQQQVADKLVAKGHKYRSGRRIINGWEKNVAKPPAAVVPDLAFIYRVTSDVILDAINSPNGQADG